MFSNAELKVEPIAGYSSVFGVECRTERRSYISVFKVCMLVNAELKSAPAALNSRRIFSNAELNVDLIARF